MSTSTTSTFPKKVSPLSGDLFSALIYSIQNMILPNTLSPQQVAEYSDLTMTGDGYWVLPYVSLDKVYTANSYYDTPQFKASNYFEWALNNSYFSSIGNQYFLYTSSKEEYDQNIADNGLLGLSFLPWNTFIVQCAADSQYYGSHKYGDSDMLKMFNPLDTPSLWLKGQTIGILIIAFILLKVSYKMIRKRI